jgi:hypothetical protein
LAPVCSYGSAFMSVFLMKCDRALSNQFLMSFFGIEFKFGDFLAAGRKGRKG